MPRVMTVDQAAEYLQLTADTIRRGARTGKIPAARIGRRWRFLQDELDAWLSAGGDQPEPEIDAWLVRESEKVLQHGERVSREEAKAALLPRRGVTKDIGVRMTEEVVAPLRG